MTDIAIEQQIKAIKKVTEKASKTNESALKFLVDAGVLKQSSGKSTSSAAKKKK